jgi:YD repeat-containing protein
MRLGWSAAVTVCASRGGRSRDHCFGVRQGRLTHIFRPGGINLTNHYDSLGRVTNRLDALGANTNWFDNLGRLTVVSNAFGQVRKTIYDHDDLVATNIDANGVSILMTYTNELGKVTQYGYNALGWKTDAEPPGPPHPN